MGRDYRRASKDLLYEIQMVYLLRAYLAGRVLDGALQTRGDHGLPARNALIESFAIHVRNVIAFLYNVRGRGATDDLIADDYVTDRHAYRKGRPPRFEGSTLDRAVVDRIHQQIAHLSHARGEYGPRERIWLFDEICASLEPVIRSFLNCVDPTKLADDFIGEVEGVLALEPSANTVMISTEAHTASLDSLRFTTAGTATAGMRLP